MRGVGSGLPLAHQMMAAAGGRLEIDGNLGGGASVTLAGPAPETVTVPPQVCSDLARTILAPCSTGGQRDAPDACSAASRALARRVRPRADTLQHRGLVARETSGARRLTEAGTSLVATLFKLHRTRPSPCSRPTRWSLGTCPQPPPHPPSATPSGREVRERLRETLNTQTYKFAFASATPVTLDDDRIVLAVDSVLLALVDPPALPPPHPRRAVRGARDRPRGRDRGGGGRAGRGGSRGARGR